MATYKEIKGVTVQTKDTDPVLNVGSWSSGGTMNQARRASGGAGSYTAGFVFGGLNPFYDVAETYNGTSWSEVNDLNTARGNLVGFGTSTAAFAVAGSSGPQPNYQTLVESWNGSSWTETTEVNTGRYALGGGGTTTAGVVFGGQKTPSSADANETEVWNGSAWTEVNNLNEGRYFLASVSAGSNTAALAVSGQDPSGNVNSVESWNGSSWTEVNDVSKAGYGRNGSGSTTAGLVFGGDGGGVTAQTESWDGTSWTEVNDLATARRSGGTEVSQSGANGTTALMAGGATPSDTGITEEWTFSGIQPTDPAAGYANAIIGDFYYNSTTGQFKNVSSGVGSWASGGNLNGGRYGIMGAGTLTAGLAMGGTFQPSDTTKNTAETYDGTSWTNAPTLPGNIRDGGSWGVQTSAVQVGGSTSPGATPFGSTAYEFDGSSFSNGGSLNTARRYNAGAGAASTAGITFGGGNPGPYVAITESYDGSTFTEVADLNTARNYLGAAGTQTAAIAAGGNTGSDVANVELWDGSSWTETTDINTARGFASPSAGMGSQTSAIVVSGNPNNVESWDGTSWTEIADLGTSRSSGHTVGFNSTSAGMYFGGSPNSYATYTEEWDQPSFQIKTVTTS